MGRRRFGRWALASCALVGCTATDDERASVLLPTTTAEPAATGSERVAVSPTEPPTSAASTAAPTEASTTTIGTPTTAPSPPFVNAPTTPAAVTSLPTNDPPASTVARTPARAPGSSSGSPEHDREAGTSVNGADLVPDVLGVPCGGAIDATACLAATNGHTPGEAISMGEYERNVFVPSVSLLDVYFDQARSDDEIEQLCRQMGGVRHTRAEDGSPWAGWRYCAGVDY